MHYSDNSHRWIAPPDVEQHLWEATIRAHLGRHMSTMGGPVRPDPLWACRPARIPVALDPVAVDSMDSGPGGTLSRLPTNDPVIRRLPGAA